MATWQWENANREGGAAAIRDPKHPIFVKNRRLTLSCAVLLALLCGEWRKALIAPVVKAETTVPLDWMAARLDMGARSTVSREIGFLTKELP